MKILLVAGFFPPFAPIAATRVNKFAKFFHGRGDDIRVLAAHNTHYPPVMKLEVPEELVHFTPVFEVADMPSNVMGRVKGMFRSGKGEQDQTGPAREAMPKPKNVQPGRLGPCFRRIKNRGRELYTGMVSVPDGRIGWYPHAIREGRRMLADWKPDLIYASAPPHTSLLVASKLSREFNIPWFCEYRDLWVDHPYYDGSWLRHLIERPLERRTLASCSGLVTVTQTWADHLQKIYEKPVAFVMNGFDPDDYEDTARIEPMSSDKLTILYAGGIYPGRRDPSALFEAMEKMGADANDIRVHFYMPDEYIEPVQQMARTHHVEHLVDVGGLVSREDVLKLQQRSDILLLLRWDSPEENGVLAGKLFEYIGAGRPVLSVGSTTGEAADVINRNGFGLVSNDVEEIAGQLRKWLDQKGSGMVSGTDKTLIQPYSRIEQFEKLKSFLTETLKKQGSESGFPGRRQENLS